MSKTAAKILLVEDSPTARSLVRVFLMGVANPIIEAESAEDAMIALDDVDIAVVVTDNQLPGVQGLDFVKRLRLDSRIHVAQVGIVMLTGQDVEAGATNAGLLAAQILALQDAVLAEKLEALRKDQAISVPDAPPGSS